MSDTEIKKNKQLQFHTDEELIYMIIHAERELRRRKIYMHCSKNDMEDGLEMDFFNDENGVYEISKSSVRFAKK